MNNSWKALCKTYLRLRIPIYRIKYETNPKTRRRNILLLIVLVITFGYLSVSLGFTALSLVLFGLGDLVPLAAVLIGSAVSLLFTIFKSGSELFSCKDYDLLMSLPIKTRTVVAVKCLVLWIENNLLIFLCMIPMGMVYLILEKVSLAGHLMWWPGLFMISLLPTVVAAGIGSLITAISSRFRYSKIIGAVLSIAALVLVLVGSMWLSTMQMEEVELFFSGFERYFSHIQTIPDLAIDTEKLIVICYDRIRTIYPPATLFSTAVMESNIVTFIGFLAFSIIPYALFVQLLSMRYKQINTALSGHSVKSNYKTKNQKEGSVLVALYKKELKRFFTSTPYLVNLMVGPVMCLVLAIALFGWGMESLYGILELPGFSFEIDALVPYAFAATLSMGCTTCVSISMEGKNVWIIKSLPLPEKEIYTSKIWVNLTITIPVGLLSAVFAAIRLKSDAVSMILLFLIPLVFSIFSAILGILVNIFFCAYDWEDETHLVKQSMSSFIGLFAASVLSMVFGGLAALLPISANIFSFIIVMMMGCISIALYKIVIKRPLP